MSFTRSKNYYVDTAAKMVFRDEDADVMELLLMFHNSFRQLS